MSEPQMLHAYVRDLRIRSPRGHIRVAQVQEEYGLPRQTVYKWESESGRPEPVDLRAYLLFLGATESQITEAMRLRSLCVGRAAPARESTAGAA